MFVVLGLVPLFIVIAVVWPIVAIAKQQERSEYTFTACVAAWYVQIMAMVGIVVFTIGMGELLTEKVQAVTQHGETDQNNATPAISTIGIVERVGKPLFPSKEPLPVSFN